MIIKFGPFSSFLPPMIAVEDKLSVEEFLERACWMAQLSPDYWLDQKTKLYRFETQNFSEIKPNGAIAEKA